MTNFLLLSSNWPKNLISCTFAVQPPKNSLGIFTPTWFTSATFLSKDDHRKFVAGTNSHQVILSNAVGNIYRNG